VWANVDANFVGFAKEVYNTLLVVLGGSKSPQTAIVAKELASAGHPKIAVVDQMWKDISNVRDMCCLRHCYVALLLEESARQGTI